MILGLLVTTLRQYRAQVLITAALLTVLVAVAVTDGLAIAAMTTELGNASCPSTQCENLAEQVRNRYQGLGQLLPYFGLLPAAIGAFWGAPLLGREYETGTASFAWTQSVSRRSWILTRMFVLGTLVVLGGATVGLTVDHWLSLFGGSDLPGAVESDTGFSHLRGATPIAWWLFGFTLGAAGGALLRRTLPAMAVTVMIVVTALIARNLWIAWVTAGQPLSAAPQLLHIEIATLLTTSLLLATATCWSVERARV